MDSGGQLAGCVAGPISPQQPGLSSWRSPETGTKPSWISQPCWAGSQGPGAVQIQGSPLTHGVSLYKPPLSYHTVSP